MTSLWCYSGSEKALCSLSVCKCIMEQSDEAADLHFVIFGVTRTGMSCPALDASLPERCCQKETERRTREFIYKRKDYAK